MGLNHVHIDNYKFTTSPFRKHLKFNLFTIHGCLLQTLGLWFRAYDRVRFVDATGMKMGPKIEMMAYQVSNDVKKQ